MPEMQCNVDLKDPLSRPRPNGTPMSPSPGTRQENIEIHYNIIPTPDAFA